MPRKAWIRLHRSLLFSSTWRQTVKGGRDEFLALLLLANNEGVVSKADVETLHLACWFSHHGKTKSRTAHNVAKLIDIGAIMKRSDGSIHIPKYRDYQYLQGFRSDLLPQKLNNLVSSQNRTEQSRAESPHSPPKGELVKQFEYDALFVEEFWPEWIKINGLPGDSKQEAGKRWNWLRDEGFDMYDVMDAEYKYLAKVKACRITKKHASTFLGSRTAYKRGEQLPWQEEGDYDDPRRPT